MTEKLGNEDSLAKIRNLRETANEVMEGDKLSYTFKVDYTSKNSGDHYEGVVVLKRLHVGDYLRQGGLKSEILRSAGVRDLRLVDPPVLATAQVLASLKIGIIKAPDWLVMDKLDKFRDPDVLWHIFDAYEKWQDSFRPRSAEESEGDSEPSSAPADVGASEVLRESTTD